MATPAEIIAARVNGTYVADVPSENSTRTSSSSPQPNDTTRSIESAFPVLGGGQGPKSSPGTATHTWGPQANGKVPASFASTAPSGLARMSSDTRVKVSTVQEAFSLDADDQLNVARPEFIKILTSIKTTTSSNIECTTSQHTRKRTFLITGKPEQVKLAKRLIIKKLTKPVTVSFTIPAKVRAKVIGAQGRNLKPIIRENEVKIDISNPGVGGSNKADTTSGSDDDDEFSQTVTVTLEGDAEGCKAARSQILSIVKEDLKNSQVKVSIDEYVKPFASSAFEDVISKHPDLEITLPPHESLYKSVIISGDRDEALSAKEEIKQICSSLLKGVTEENHEIPSSKHAFIPIQQILDEDRVLITLPDKVAETSSVRFVGKKENIAKALSKVQKVVSQYKVETLDMAKAHRGNIPHVRAVAAMFSKYGAFDAIAKQFGVKINPPVLTVSEDNSIPVDIIVKSEDVENTKNTRRAIVAAVNKVTPDQTLNVSDIDPFFYSKIPEILDNIADCRYVILDNILIVFDYSSEGQSDDFDDFEENQSTVLAECERALDNLRSMQESLTKKVLHVPSSEQSHISGPNGSTLRSILATTQPDSVKVSLHTNASGKSKNEILISGFKSNVSQVEKDILEILTEAKEYAAAGGYQTTFEVPTFVLSRVIGKGGSNLNGFRDQFGIKIDIEGDAKDSEKADKSQKTNITLHGIKRNVEAAKEAITSLTKKLADDTLERLRIEGQYHRRIHGPNFSYTNRLQDRYNVKIRFPSEFNASFADAPLNENEITVRGPSRNVQKAVEEIKQLYQYEKENGFKTTIKIPSTAIARVIGKNGNTIGDISDGTGVDYRFSRDREQEEANGYAEVELTGSKTGLKEATQRIQEIISDVENFTTVTINVEPIYHRDLVGSNGSVLREIISKAGGDKLSRLEYTRLLTIPNEGSDSDEIVCSGNKDIVSKIVEQIKNIVANKKASITEEYELAKEKHRLLVGPGGTIRHALQEEFDVQIYVPKSSSTSTKVELTGLPEKIAKLKVKLEEMTKDNWNISIDVPCEYHALVSDKGAIVRTLRLEHNVEVSHGTLGKKAAALSNAPIPNPPETMNPADDSNTDFVTGALNLEHDQITSIPWRFIGSDDATKAAAKTVELQLERAKLSTTSGWLYCKNPSVQFPKIIGPQGSRINKVRKNTGAFITVPRATDKNNHVIYLVGTEDSVQNAKEEILKLL